jgi:hypothetical protein
MDMVTKKVLKVIDTEIVPVANGAVNYEEISERPRPGTTSIGISQPMGASFVSSAARFLGRIGTSASASTNELAPS